MKFGSARFVLISMIFLFGSIYLYAQKSQQSKTYLSHAVQGKRWLYTSEGRWDGTSGIPRTLYHVNYGPLTGTPEEMARTFLTQNKTKFKMKDGLDDLHTISLQETPGGHHVRFEQQYQGIPIYRSDVVVSIDKKNFIGYVSNNYKTGISVASVQPSLSREDALQNAHDYLQVKGAILGTEDAKLMIYAEGDSPRLSYRVAISCTDPRGAWEVFIDAQTGEVIRAQDLRMFDRPRVRTSLGKATVFTNGSGNVFIPDPLTSANEVYNTPGYADNNDADSPQLDSQLVRVTLKNISFDGTTYTLTGPYVSIVDWDPPSIPPATSTNPDLFRFNRSQSGFEDVNVYYNIDSSQRRVQELGYTDIQNLPLAADPHGDFGADNSYYDPNLNALTFGQGGVDDAEDADVIWHEYHHALQQGIVPGFGDTTGGNEEGMIAEGGADYWAGSYSRSINPVFSRNFVFTWDAGFDGTTGTIWPGRPLNNPASYPANGVRGMEVHDAGELWSSVLLLIWDDIGKQVMDKLILEGYYYIGPFATMRDNAEAIIQADYDLFGGIHIPQIAARFTQRNFIPGPKFTHQPLKDSENLNGPFPVTTIVQPGYFPNAANGIKVFWGHYTLFTDSVTLSPTGNLNEYTGIIPGNGAPSHYRYYLSARDTYGNITTYPSDAPVSFFSFYVGTDTIPPVASHSPLYDPAKALWPPAVRVNARDNMGIDSVWIEYIRQRGNLAGTFPLVKTNDTTFQAPFGLDTSQLIIGDSIFYKAHVKDVSTLANTVTLPDTGYYKFMITKIKILIGDQLSSSTRILYNTLVTKDYAVDSALWGGVLASNLPKYDLLIISAGTNAFPNLLKRPAMISRVENGGKILVEGGNVGSYFRKPDGASGFDNRFRVEVLHDSAWISDATASNLNLTQPFHPLFTTPNIISSPIVFSTFTAASDRDAMTLIPGDTVTKTVAAWSEAPTSAGIIINKPTGSLTPLTIFFPFALSSITDSAVAKKLIENTVAYFFPNTGTTDVQDEHHTTPTSFSLQQNYPNPFNPVTVIRFQLPVYSKVTLKVYNVLGQEVSTLMNEVQGPGYRSVGWNASNSASGVYFYRLNAVSVSDPGKSFNQVKKMVLIR